MTGKYLINCQSGPNELESATVSMIVAGAAAAMEAETAVFLTCDAVRLATKGGMDGLQQEGYPTLSDLQDAFAENGGQLWVCPVCAAARGITADDLVENAEIAGAARTIGFVDDMAPSCSCDDAMVETWGCLASGIFSRVRV